MSAFLFDLDGVVLHTTTLNNKSYNYSLFNHNLKEIDTDQRITRKIVKELFPSIDKDTMKSIVDVKQKFFIRHIHEVEIDHGVMRLITALKKEQCFIWTAAEHNRAIHLIETFNLLSYFDKIFFFPKSYLKHDLEAICKYLALQPSNLYVFEDNSDNCKLLHQYGVNCFLYLNQNY